MATPSPLGNLTTIIKRLEAATSRLEDLAEAQAAGAPTAPTVPVAANPAAAAAAGAVAGAAAVTVAGGAPPPPPPPPPPPAPEAPAPPLEPEEPKSIAAFDEAVKEPLAKYVELSNKIGGLVADQAADFAKTFDAQRTLIWTAAESKKPVDGFATPGVEALLKPLQVAVMATTEVREKNRAERKLFNHLSAISEGAPAVGWVAVEPKPAPFVGEMKDAAQFYSNRVIKEFKETDKTHVEWTRAFSELLTALQGYVKQYHTTGLAWNPNGGDPLAFQPPSADGAPAAPPAPPAPPGAPAPPPPPPAAVSSGSAGGMDAVFAQLNQGEGITKALKKVDDSQKTHKNPDLRGHEDSSNLHAAMSGRPKVPSKPVALRTKKPPVLALEGNKWTIENQVNERNIVIKDTEIGHTINVFHCTSTTIQIKGKVNQINVVSCTKLSLVFDSVVASVDITHSPSFEVQVTGKVPTILLDGCDSGQVYLSSESLEVDIVTSKCSAINVSVPKNGSDEFTELALPEQMKHTFPGGKLQTEIVAHAG